MKWKDSMVLLNYMIVFLCALNIAWAAVPNVETKKVYQFGVFAYLGEEETRKEFTPVINYLNSQLTHEHIELQVLSQEEIYKRVASKELDLVSTNPIHYLAIRDQHKLSGPIASLVRLQNGQPNNYLAGTILTGAHRTDINSLKDIKDKVIAIPGYEFLGGYQAQAFELHQAGIHLPEDARRIDVKGNHYDVVKALVNGEVDVGFVREGILEQMINQGVLRANKLKVINAQYAANTPYQVSTRRYPEWPVIALPHVPESVQRRVAALLLSYEPSHSSNQASGIHGFSIPADYLPVETLSRTLKLPPFDQHTEITISDIWQEYALIILSLFATLLFLITLSIVGWRFYVRAKYNSDYVRDILDAQRAIVVINDGQQLRDISGEFFRYFPEFKNLQHFSLNHRCICDLFAHEPGYVYNATQDLTWIKVILESPYQEHKALIRRNNKELIFRVWVDFSKKLNLYVITLVDIRELELANQQLLEQKKRADDASRSKSEFIANMSHEIRTPMNGIIGLSELGMTEIDPSKTQHYLARINQAGKLLLSIINDILDISKIEAGKMEILPAPFYLGRLLDQINGLFEPLAENKGIIFNLTVDNALLDVYIGDELRLRQVLVNLISNAIKFTEKGSVQLSIHSWQDKDRSGLCFAVKDTGIGLTDKQKSRLFHAFQQADNSIERKYGGTGLGLVISQRLVHAMGGDEGILIQSQPNEGATFSFSIPLPKATKQQRIELLSQLNQSKKTDEQVALQGHVLLVEDNIINQEVASAQLKKLGLEVTIAENGAIAVAKAQTESFDLILMDIQMPVMDGYQATELIRQFNKQIPIIALTAAAMNEDKTKALAYGMNGHLSKPIDKHDLISTLHHWLSQAKHTEPLPVTSSHLAIAPAPHLSSQQLITTEPDRLQVTNKTATILIVDDVPANIRALANSLKKEYHILVATTGNKALEIARTSTPPDLILLDIIMPDIDGYEVCRQLKNDDHTHTIPIIFVSALSEATEEEKGLNLGAVDYIAKPFHLPIVRARVRNHLKLKQKTDLLETMSLIDGLTHVANRRQFDETFAKETLRCLRYGHYLGIIMIDIDYFKPFNDNYGHGKGDECLIKVAAALKHQIRRSSDLFARYGGEEFVALLPESHPEEVAAMAEKLRDAVDQLHIQHEYSAISDHVTISLGGASELIESEQQALELLRKADKALYQAKAMGRNRVVMYSQD